MIPKHRFTSCKIYEIFFSWIFLRCGKRLIFLEFFFFFFWTIIFIKFSQSHKSKKRLVSENRGSVRVKMDGEKGKK